MDMKIKKLIAAIEVWKPTDKDIRAFEERIAEKERQFAEEAKKRELPKSWLNKFLGL